MSKSVKSSKPVQTKTIAVQPHIAARIVAEAKRIGVSPDSLASDIVEQYIDQHSETATKTGDAVSATAAQTTPLSFREILSSGIDELQIVNSGSLNGNTLTLRLSPEFLKVLKVAAQMYNDGDLTDWASDAFRSAIECDLYDPLTPKM